MIDTEDPVLAALGEQDDKLDWQGRKGDSCLKKVLARGVAIREFFARIVERISIWTKS